MVSRSSVPCRVVAALLIGGLVAVGGCSRSTKPVDGIRPAPIRDLRVVAVTESTVTLVWTATGDDDRAGTASAYDLRRMTSPISEQDWTSGIQVGPLPSPAPASTRETYVVRSLPEGQRQFFALKAQDDVGLWSLISNQATAKPGLPQCAISPESLAFGVTAVGTHFDLPMTITNAGGGTLAGEPVLSCAEFEVVAGGGEFHLGADSTLHLVLRFAPAGLGPRSCVLRLGTACGEVHCAGSGGEVRFNLIPVVSGSTSFTMGSPASEPGREADEGEHGVILSSYQVSTREVVQSEWLAIMGWNESRFAGADLPVENITWFDAVEFCDSLSKRDNLEMAYGLTNIVRVGHHIISADVSPDTTSDGYRLLTEAEWENACRAGTRTAFSNGGITDTLCSPADPNLDLVGWYCANSGGTTHPVESRQANGLGLYDLHGNVFEWCWDWYGRDYGQTLEEPGAPLHTQVNPKGPAEGDGRVVRGGSWRAGARDCRSAYRLFFRPGTYSEDVGLRIGRGGSPR